MQDFALLIGGQLVPGDSTMAVIDPANGEPFAKAPAASLRQLNQAVDAAGQAFHEWRQRPFSARREIVAAIADAIAEQGEELARILARETGKPLAAARGELNSTVEYIRYFTTLTLEPELVEDSPVRRVEIHREPLGVVAAIIAWNFPLLLMAFKLPAALLAGNTVLLKPATTTPLATLHLGRLLSGIVPAGVVNVIAGGDELGPALTAHPGIRKISFTGSTDTGRRVMASAAANLTRITLELGGNDPAIVLDDVDVEKTAARIFASAFGNSGQVCRAVKRVYAHATIYEPLCAALAERARQAVVGDAATANAEFGPVQNATQYVRLKELLDDCHANGTVMPGGGLMERDGYFIRPTIVKDIANDSRIVSEEQFGPILPIVSFTDAAEAIRFANAGPYGLAASVWTTDMQRARELAAQLNVGTVWINKHIDRTPHVPVAGAKQSGIGAELGVQGLHDFTQIKVVNASVPA